MPIISSTADITGTATALRQLLTYMSVLGVMMCIGCGHAGDEAGETEAMSPNGEVAAGTANPVKNAEGIGQDPTDRGRVISDGPDDVCEPSGGCEGIPMLDNALKYPLVLAHGMGGFDEFWGLTYYVGVSKALRKKGYAAYTSRVDPMNGSDVRGKQLAAFLDRVLDCTCAEKVNIIAHSQGGIDARYVVDVLGYDDRVASVTTVASPHRGTPMADAMLAVMPGSFDPLVDFFAWIVGGLYNDGLEDPKTRAALTWCSSEFMASFSETYPPSDKVSWYSYAGRAGITGNGIPECEAGLLPNANPKAKSFMHAAMAPGWTFLGGLKGIDNDGLVTVESAQLGEFMGCIPADHLQEIGMFIGMWPVFDHKSFYKAHAARLVSRGH